VAKVELVRAREDRKDPKDAHTVQTEVEEFVIHSRQCKYLLISLNANKSTSFIDFVPKHSLEINLTYMKVQPMVLALPFWLDGGQHALSKLIAYYSTKWIVSMSKVCKMTGGSEFFCL